MNDPDDFNRHAHEVIDWITNYYKNLEQYPVKSQVAPQEIYQQLPEHIPDEGISISQILEVFDNVLMQGITHWQSPNFFAYFPANSSLPSVLAEMITAALGAQCMKWETSPAATELEEKVMNWLKQAIGLPDYFEGVIQDSASTATLVSLLTARERYTNYRINEKGFQNQAPFRVYCSREAHSSVEKAVKIAGIGKSNLVKIDVDEQFRVKPQQLNEAIEADKKKGMIPLCIVATIGTTSSTAIDPLSQITPISKKQGLWLHVDAAYAGTALILPEYQWMLDGRDDIDTIVFNPHKWLFTNFDCSAYFVKDKHSLVKTFQLIPEYLKTRTDEQANNYSDWTIPLGRRFRALKLWFVLNYYGMHGLQRKLRNHIQMAHALKNWIEQHEDFELLAPLVLNVLCFRYKTKGVNSTEKLNALNEELLHKVNQTGEIYMTHTKLSGKYTLRLVIAQTYMEMRHVKNAWDIIQRTASKL